MRIELEGKLVGAVIDSKYRVESFVGRGGMGTVWKAEHLMLHRPVAIKLLRKDLDSSGSDEALKRFHREAAVASRLRHDNTVLLYDFGVFDGMPYLAMEYLDGETLRSRMRREGKISPFKAAAWCSQIAEGLQEAHALGILHRDLKPENVMLVNRGAQTEQAVVLDFGIAKLLDASGSAGGTLTENGAVLGTPNYMSPEQIRGEKITYAADVYSLGIILFEMLSGNVPFKGDSPLSIALKHLNELPGSLRHTLRDFPFAEPLDEILKKTLAKRVEDRYASPAAVSAALADALAPYQPLLSPEPAGDETTSRTPVPFLSSLSRPLQYCLTAFLLLIFGAVYTLFTPHSDSRTARKESTSEDPRAALASEIVTAPSPEQRASMKESARDLSRSGQHTAALAVFRELLQNEPMNPELLAQTGVSLMSREAVSPAELNEAGELLRRAIQLAPGALEHRLRYGELLALQKRFDDAISLFRTALKQKPGDPAILTSLGRSLLAAGKPDQAATQCRAALKANPKDAAASFALAESYFALKRIPMAIEACKNGLRHDPENIRAMTRCAELLEGAGKKKLALALYNQAFAASPGDLAAAAGRSRLKGSK